MTTALEEGEGSASRPGRSLPPGKTQYPLYRRLDGPQGRSGQVRKISLPPGFDPRTVQPVASRYTDWATRPTTYIQTLYKSLLQYSASIIEHKWQYVKRNTVLWLTATFDLPAQFAVNKQWRDIGFWLYVSYVMCAYICLYRSMCMLTALLAGNFQLIRCACCKKCWYLSIQQVRDVIRGGRRWEERL